MAYYDFPHTRNYDTDLGYLIKKYQNLQEEIDNIDISNLQSLPDKVTTNTNDISNLKTRIKNNENNITSLQDISKKYDLRITANETNISTLSNDIKSLDSRVDETEDDIKDLQSDVVTIANNELESKTDINELKTRTTQLESNEQNYLQSVNFNSTDIEFRQDSKANGIQTYTAVVKSATPVNLNENLSTANTTNATLVTNIGDLALDSESDENSIKINHVNTYLSGGTLHTHTDSNIALSKDNFMINGNGAIDTKLDYEETTNKITEITNNVSAIQEDVNTNTETISNLHDELETPIDITNLITKGPLVENIIIYEATMTKTNVSFMLDISLKDNITNSTIQNTSESYLLHVDESVFSNAHPHYSSSYVTTNGFSNSAVLHTDNNYISLTTWNNTLSKSSTIRIIWNTLRI